ncbi:MAG: ABC transporter ATP-binding protein [Gemmatimonadetes bacterium]|nr:ABC transporter ATP-binding protein [Gemmatimonadota bacterium]
MGEALIVLDGLTRRFGALTAVDRLSLEVRTGELFGIVGPDGAGKTTTLRMLAGVLPPSAGEAHIAGISVGRDPEGAKPFLAYMAQRFGLYEDLTVRENIEFYADLYRVPRRDRPARLERLYAFSNLGEFEHRLAGKLSGGMKQKLALCCSLIHHPRLLLLDEPTFGVDPISRRDLWLILHELVAEGVTVVVSTSYLDEAERCDRVALLHQGRMLALDAPTVLQESMSGRLFAVTTAAPRAARDRLRAHPAVQRAVLFGDLLHVVVQPDTPAASIAAVPGVQAVRPLDASLEDVFIHLVGEAAGQEAAA